MDIYCFPFARGRVFEKQEKDLGQYNNKEKCFWSSGTCFMVRKNLFYDAGGFDDTFFAHMEEIDLCWSIFFFYRIYIIYNFFLLLFSMFVPLFMCPFLLCTFLLCSFSVLSSVPSFPQDLKSHKKPPVLYSSYLFFISSIINITCSSFFF